MVISRVSGWRCDSRQSYVTSLSSGARQLLHRAVGTEPCTQAPAGKRGGWEEAGRRLGGGWEEAGRRLGGEEAEGGGGREEAGRRLGGGGAAGRRGGGLAGSVRGD